MAEEKRAPEQDPSEGSRETIERELQRKSDRDGDHGSGGKGGAQPSGGSNEKIAIATPVEPGDQNAQTTPPSM